MIDRKKDAERWYKRQLKGERLIDIAREEGVTLNTVTGTLAHYKKNTKAYKVRKELFG